MEPSHWLCHFGTSATTNDLRQRLTICTRILYYTKLLYREVIYFSFTSATFSKGHTYGQFSLRSKIDNNRVVVIVISNLYNSLKKKITLQDE